MNFYDEEITINGPDTKNLRTVRVDRLSSGKSERGLSGVGSAARARRNTPSGSRNRRTPHQRGLMLGNSTDDDGLLQDIVDHDDEDDDDDDDSDLQRLPSSSQNATKLNKQSPLNRTNPRPASAKNVNLANVRNPDNDTEQSETESDDGVSQPRMGAGAMANSTDHDMKLSITPEKWENLQLNQELKDIFPYILKYTPQNIETPYHLQPFILEYVPAVGDVDAFLKVTIPTLLQPQRQQEVNEHLRRMGLYFLDEPSGEQSEPSLLNMKLRSVLTGSGINPRSASASLIPTVRNPKDIDKWITEVEQVHMTQAIYDAQPRKDIDAMLVDWPRAYADVGHLLQDAYQRCQQGQISLLDYVREICHHLNVDGPLHTQADYILNVHTLFALYLGASQAWD